MKNQELEYKWEANSPRAFQRARKALAGLGVLKGIGSKLHIVDYYIDTPTRTFEKQHIAMRLRQTNGHWEATFKTRTEVIAGKAVRREETCALPDAVDLESALSLLKKKKKWKKLDVSQLKLLFVLTNKREIVPVCFQNMQAELAFDNCCLSVCGRKVCFKEIELELKRGAVQLLEKLANLFTQKTSLPYAHVSKVKTGMYLMQLWEGK